MREILSYSFAIPPTIFIVICLCGTLIALARPSLGTKISLLSSVALYVFATPAVSSFLLQQLIANIPASVDLKQAQAIVIPGADIIAADHDRGFYSIGPTTLERLASGAQLYAQMRLPIVVSGGPSGDAPISLAKLMSNDLEHLFSIPVSLTEDSSQNTFENALFTSHLLKAEHIHTVIVVVQARDMSRALWSFNRAGVHALPYCTDSCQRRDLELDPSDFLPSAKAFSEVYYAIHEIIGLAYYRSVY